jgi:hypothetical protein
MYGTLNTYGVCKTKTYFMPEQKTNTTAQLEKGSSSPHVASVYDRKKRSSSRLSCGCAIVITTGKKGPVVCLAGARSLLRPENKKVPVVYLFLCLSVC